MCTSWSGSSLSRWSSWAVTRFATASSIGVPTKMIRSLSRREYRSKARSPRWSSSITVGTANGCSTGHTAAPGVEDVGGEPEAFQQQGFGVEAHDRPVVAVGLHDGGAADPGEREPVGVVHHELAEGEGLAGEAAGVVVVGEEAGQLV